VVTECCLTSEGFFLYSGENRIEPDTNPARNPQAMRPLFPSLLSFVLLSGTAAFALPAPPKTPPAPPGKTAADPYDALRVLLNAGQFDKAIPGLKKLAEKNNPRAQNALGVCYVRGLGVPKDPVKAFFWIQKASKQGLAHAHYSFAGLYFQGVGVPKNLAMARKFLEKGVEGGDDEAQTSLGEMYLFGGGGVAKDVA
jgi:TPR repeat protein